MYTDIDACMQMGVGAQSETRPRLLEHRLERKSARARILPSPSHGCHGACVAHSAAYCACGRMHASLRAERQVQGQMMLFWASHDRASADFRC